MASYTLGGVRIEVVSHSRVDGRNFPRPDADLIAEAFEIDLFDAATGQPLRIIHGSNRLTEYWVGRKVRSAGSRGADYRGRFWPEVRRRVSKYLAADALGVPVGQVTDEQVATHRRSLVRVADPENLKATDLDAGVRKLTGRAPRTVTRLPRGTVANIDVDFDSWAASNGAEDVTPSVIFVLQGATSRRGQVRFPLSTLPAGLTVNDSDIQFNVTLEGAEAGEGVTVRPYNATGESDPESDSGSTKYTRSGNGTGLVDIDCNGTGSKTGDLGATGDSVIQGAVDSPDFVAFGFDIWNLTAENVQIEALANGGSDPPTLTVDYSTVNAGTMAATMQPATASLAGSQPVSGAVAATLTRALASLSGRMQPEGAMAATMQAALAEVSGLFTVAVEDDTQAFASGEDRPHAALYVNGELFVGLLTTPGILLRFNAPETDLSDYDVLTFPNDGEHHQIYQITYSPVTGMLYPVFADTSVVTVDEVDPTALTRSALVSETVASGAGIAPSVIVFGSSIYVVPYVTTTVANVRQYSITTGALEDTVTFTGNRQQGHAVTTDGTHLYVTGSRINGAAGGWIAKVDPSDLTFTVQTLDAEFDGPTDDMVAFDGFVWLGNEAAGTYLGYLARVDTSDVSQITYHSIGVDGSQIFAVAEAYGYIWAVVGGSPGRIVRVDPVTLTTAPVVLTSEANEFATGEHGYFYITHFTVPGAVTRLQALAVVDATGTMSATLQAATAALTGSQTQSGTLAATMTMLQASLAGVMQPEATMAALMQALTASLAGEQTQSGAIAAEMQEPTAALTGDQTQTGTISAEMQEPTASMTGAQVYTGTIDADMQALMASLAGSQEQSGTISAELTEPTAALTGGVPPEGSIDASMQPATFAGAGATIGQIAATITRMAFAGAGEQTLTAVMAAAIQQLVFDATQKNEGQLGATMQPATFSGEGGQAQSGAMAATLQALLFVALAQHILQGVDEFAGAPLRSPAVFGVPTVHPDNFWNWQFRQRRRRGRR